MEKLLILGLLLLHVVVRQIKNIMIVSGDIDGLKKGTIYLQKQKIQLLFQLTQCLLMAK